jgi:hypothetical protein
VTSGLSGVRLELRGAECYVTVENQPGIFDDESLNPADVARHPKREVILVKADKEIDQLIEQEIEYTIGEDDKEWFLKWKSRLVVVGSSEREGWETVYSTFSSTVGFSAVRLLISLTVDPRFSVESYE